MIVHIISMLLKVFFSAAKTWRTSERRKWEGTDSSYGQWIWPPNKAQDQISTKLLAVHLMLSNSPFFLQNRFLAPEKTV